MEILCLPRSTARSDITAPHRQLNRFEGLGKNSLKTGHNYSMSRQLFMGGFALRRLFQLHENRVHLSRMKNITLSADPDLIEHARAVARSQRKTLNAVFREWLLQFTAQSGNGPEVDALMKRLRHVQPGRQFSREEMNER